MKNKLLLIVIIITVTLIFFPKVNFGQAPNLGTASGFALFTASGAFENVGDTSTTYITGDIGTHAGAFTGFPPGKVDGQIHVADLTSKQAATDVDSAYNFLNGISCDTAIGTALGNGQVLTPKVYCLITTSTLNGDLILNGQGNPNALFIFKINGALSTSISSKVILIDSASLRNVYWQINGAFELGDSSVFRGTIIANGAISLLESSSLVGRGLSRLGAIYLHNNMVETGTRPANQLPIELLSFDAKADNDFVNITWTTTSETNNDYFTIEKSKDANHFGTIAIISGAGNSNKILQYSTNDYDPYQGISYYRLKQTDFDGAFTYSNLVEVDFVRQLADDVNIYPNPFNSSIYITINEASQINNSELRIYNAFGIEVMNTIINKQVTMLETSNLAAGIYSYELIGDSKTIQSGKLIAQK